MLLQQFRHGEDRADTHLFGRATGNGNTEFFKAHQFSKHFSSPHYWNSMSYGGSNFKIFKGYCR